MKNLMMIGILVFGLFLLGCQPSVEEAMGYNFKQGIAEVNFNLLEKTLTQKIYPGSSFKLMVEVDNQAAYDAANGQVKIIGLDEKYFQLTPTEQNFETLAGRSLTAPAGDKALLEFDGLAGQLFANAQEYIGNFFLKASYNSQMEFADTVCINPNLYAIYDSGCPVEERKTFSGQGAPLAITGMEEIIYPHSRVEFRLTLQNRGRGEIKFVNLEKSSLGGKELDCQFPGGESSKRSVTVRKTVRKERPEIILVCQGPLRGQSSYTTALALKFSYDYEFKEQHRLRLVNPLSVSR